MNEATTTLTRADLDLSSWLIEPAKIAVINRPEAPPASPPEVDGAITPKEPLAASSAAASDVATKRHEKSTRASGSLLSVYYVRLFGAMQVPVLFELQMAGGPECTQESCSIGGKTRSNRAGQGVSKKIAEYWDKQWKFKSAVLVETPLLSEIVDKSGLSGWGSLMKIDQSLANCYRARFMEPWQSPSYSRSLTDKDCSAKDSDRVGFLLLRIKNTSNAPLQSALLCFKSVRSNDSVASYLKAFQGQVPGCDRELELAEIGPLQEMLLPISVYESDDRGFERTLLREAFILRKITFVTQGKTLFTEIREPHRENAARIRIPFGWYMQ